MNQEIKNRWVKWLRENPDKQAHGTLISRDGCYCVLGVLCYVVDPDNHENWHGCSYPTPGIIKEAKVNPILEHESELKGLIYLNDQLELTFPELADLIEEQL